jgi:cytosine/adenosine deaminase-related metal-dependent hydrolase
MRRLAANYIFPVSSAPIRNGILEISDEGEVLNVIDPGKSFRESRKIEFYNGILVPGFINCHCHLELSSMKNQIPAGTGLKGFIKKVRKERTKKTRDEIERALKLADIEMKQNGIIACGDISNTASSFQVKSQSVISYYTFIELFGFQGKRAENIYSRMVKNC